MSKSIWILIAIILLLVLIGAVYYGYEFLHVMIGAIVGGFITLAVAIYQFKKREKSLYKEKHYDLKAEAFKIIIGNVTKFRRLIDMDRRNFKILSDALNDVRQLSIYPNKAILSKQSYGVLEKMLSSYQNFVSSVGNRDPDAKEKMEQDRKDGDKKYSEFEEIMKDELHLREES